MIIYQILLLIGAVGLLAQAVLGFAHGGHIGGHSASGGHGHIGGHTQGGNHGHSQNSGHSNNNERSMASLWTLLSPLTIFSVCVGAGAVGLLVARSFLPALLVALLALAGGIGFHAILVRPLWNMMLRFASKPAQSLKGAVATNAEAMSRFDTSGKGVVRITVDGQTVRLLAQLEKDDLAEREKIGIGETLLVTHVDGKENTCRVARL